MSSSATLSGGKWTTDDLQPLADDGLRFLWRRNNRPCEIKTFQGLEPLQCRSSTTSVSRNGPEPVTCKRKAIDLTIGLVAWKNSCAAPGSTTNAGSSTDRPPSRRRESPECFDISERSGRVGGFVVTRLINESPMSVEWRSSDMNEGTCTSTLVFPVKARSLLHVSTISSLRPVWNRCKTSLRPR